MKIISIFVEQIISKVKPLTVTLPPDTNLKATILTSLSTELEANFDSYFLDIKEKFIIVGATEWISANSSISGMQDFAKRMQQVDSTVDFLYWSPLVDVWNDTEPPSASSGDNISAIMITKSTSMRCLQAIATAAAKLISGEEISKENKINRLEYLRSVLPSICFRGDNFSVNFLECLGNNVKEMINTNVRSIDGDKETSDNIEKKKKQLVTYLV